MHLIGPLAAGIRGAENGTVDVFRRGTSTRATYYTDFEATVATTPSSSLPLDANGRVLLYVNEPVDVDCYASDGTLVLTFTAGDAAPAVEYQGQSFTGQNYTTAASGAGSGYATTVQAVLDKWKDSSGAIDFKVSVGGVATRLQDAMTAAQPLYFDVTSSAYGATGDGVTDDGTAIAAAVTAAVAAGGGVIFFPAGNYRTTAAIAIPDKVSVLGADSGSALIGVDHATANVFTVTSTFTAERQFIAGVTMGALQANSGAHVGVTSSYGLIIRDCQLGTSLTNGGCVNVAAYANSQVIVENCRLTMGGSSSSGIYVAGAAKRVQAHNCVFILPATFSGTPIIGDHIDVIDCVLDGSLSTAGTFSYFTAKTTTLDATVEGCVFKAGGGATVTAITLGSYGANSRFYEASNNFGQGITPYSYTVNSYTNVIVQLITREALVYSANLAASPLSLPTDLYGIIEVNVNVAGAVTVNATLPPDGAFCFIYIVNQDGSSRNFTPGAAFSQTGAKSISSLDNNSMHCRSVNARLHNIWEK